MERKCVWVCVNNFYNSLIQPLYWRPQTGGYKNRNPRNPPKFTKSNVYY